jgi:hypothetical protein
LTFHDEPLLRTARPNGYVTTLRNSGSPRDGMGKGGDSVFSMPT